jgi:hypothetical protein
MKTIGRLINIACSAVVLTGFIPALATTLQQVKPAKPGAQNVPGGGISSREEMTIISDPAANFGPQPSSDKVNVSWVAAPPVAASAPSADAQTLPPKKPQPTPQKVISEHFAAFNTCDWKRLMAQYDDDMAFLSKDGAVVKGRQAISQMFRKALQPPAAGGVCGIKLTPEQTIVVGDTVNVVWRADAPFLAEPYRGSEAFETRNGLLVVQVTTWDPPAMKMKK